MSPVVTDTSIYYAKYIVYLFEELLVIGSTTKVPSFILDFQ